MGQVLIYMYLSFIQAICSELRIKCKFLFLHDLITGFISSIRIKYQNIHSLVTGEILLGTSRMFHH